MLAAFLILVIFFMTGTLFFFTELIFLLKNKRDAFPF